MKLFTFLIFTIVSNAALHTSIQWDNITNLIGLLVLINKYTITFKVSKEYMTHKCFKKYLFIILFIFFITSEYDCVTNS